MVEKVENKEIKITLPKSILGILTGEKPGNVVMLRARDGEHVIEIDIRILKDLICEKINRLNYLLARQHSNIVIHEKCRNCPYLQEEFLIGGGVKLICKISGEHKEYRDCILNKSDSVAVGNENK